MNQTKKMVYLKRSALIWITIATVIVLLPETTTSNASTEARPRRIIVDTDVDTDDVFALLYLLKQDRTEFDLQAITINANGWSDSGHAVNHVYDILFMMGRDDIPVGVGGEGAILPNSTILPNVGGYLPIIDQGRWTSGECRYRQSIPMGRNGRLAVNSNFGLRRSFLPQGERSYKPMEQTTAQQVLIDAVSAGPLSVFLFGAHTNLAIFLMSHPHLKKNVEHIYAMGGAVEATSSDGMIGNLFPDDTNPFAEFNIFADPFAAYTVLHSGIPITLVPLDATKTIPVDQSLFDAFEKSQATVEAQYCFQSLKMARDTWMADNFYEQYCMWDSFMVGVALSEMRDGVNEFAEMEYANITVVTSNEPYGVSDGSNPMLARFGVNKTGVHSGHVQMGMQDQFCIVKGQKGKCQDGYTKKTSGDEAVRVVIATKAKPNSDPNSSLRKQFYKSFLDVMNREAESGRFNIRTQFPYYQENLIKPFFGKRLRGKPVVFDMDMSAGDFISLIYLLKLPLELIDLKGVLVSGNGWASAATVNVVYDVLHMLGRDDIPVGLGDVFATGQAFANFPVLGGCDYTKFIPNGRGGFLDSDTLYGLARHLPRSPRIYTAENSVKFGAPRDTEHPELRQPSALDVWNSIANSQNSGDKITILTNGPLTNLAQIINTSENTTTSLIKEVYIVGGHITGRGNSNERGNLFTVPWNEFAEWNMFLDPLAAKAVFESKVKVTLIPLQARRQVSSFSKILRQLNHANNTPEAAFVQLLLRELSRLRGKDDKYLHVDTFLGEIIGAVVVATENQSHIEASFESKPLKVLAGTRDRSKIGQIVVDESGGKRIRVLKSVNERAYYENIGDLLGEEKQSAVIGSFEDQKRAWNGQAKKSSDDDDIVYQSIEIYLLLGSIAIVLLIFICVGNKVIKK